MSKKTTVNRSLSVPPQDVLDCINEFGHLVTYPKKQNVFTMGEIADRVFFIKDGKIKIVTFTLNGQEVIVSLRYPSEMFGLAEALCGGERTCSAETAALTRLVILPRKTFLQLMQDVPGFAFYISKVLGRRVRETQVKLSEMACYQVHERVALFLLRSIEQCGVNMPSGIKLDIKLTQEELACIVGTARSTLTSTLSNLRKEGIIAMHNKEIWVIDPEKLHHLIS